jgi:hypothetical protein
MVHGSAYFCAGVAIIVEFEGTLPRIIRSRLSYFRVCSKLRGSTPAPSRMAVPPVWKKSHAPWQGSSSPESWTLYCVVFCPESGATWYKGEP